jgi:Gas vesicle synthesis protein GvpL/GvpF
MTKPCYVYAISRHDDEGPFQLSIEGLDGASVEALACGDVAALVNLRPNQVRLSLLLAELASKVEFRLKATYVPGVALGQEVSSSRRIQQLEAEIRARPESSTDDARIQLGEVVAAALEDVRVRDARDILDRLLPHCVLSNVLASEGDDVALRVAFLLDEGTVDDFQLVVDQLASEMRGRLELALVGPLAPWDFVDLEPIGW